MHYQIPRFNWDGARPHNRLIAPTAFEIYRGTCKWVLFISSDRYAPMLPSYIDADLRLKQNIIYVIRAVDSTVRCIVSNEESANDLF
jgi:hypothetical protein